MNAQELWDSLPEDFRNADFYDSRNDRDVLTHTEIEEALEDYHDAIYDPISKTEDTDGYPVTIYAFRTKPLDVEKAVDQISPSLAKSLCEDWAEEWGNPDGDEDDQNDADEVIRHAVREFLSVRTPWQCDEVASVDLTRDQVLLLLGADDPGLLSLSQ